MFQALALASQVLRAITATRLVRPRLTVETVSRLASATGKTRIRVTRWPVNANAPKAGTVSRDVIPIYLIAFWRFSTEMHNIIIISRPCHNRYRTILFSAAVRVIILYICSGLGLLYRINCFRVFRCTLWDALPAWHLRRGLSERVRLSERQFVRSEDGQVHVHSRLGRAKVRSAVQAEQVRFRLQRGVSGKTFRR